MYTIINGHLLILYAMISYLIFTPSFNKYRAFALPGKPKAFYQINKVMYYLIFVVCTAPFFLGDFSIVKYTIYFIGVILLIMRNKVKLCNDGIVISYLLFMMWIISSLFWSESYYAGVLLIVKYSIPLLSLWLGYSAVQSGYDIYVFSKSVTKCAIIYGIFIGGISAIFTPWLYFSLGNVFLTYAGLADYFTSVIGLFFLLMWLTKKYRYMWGAGFLLLSTLLQVVRTGLGGIFLVGCFFYLFRYKARAIPAIYVIIMFFVGLVLSVPSLNEKFFGDKAGQVTAHQIMYDGAMRLDNIKTSGRSHLWEHFLEKFYEPSPLLGSGLGTSVYYLKDKKFGYSDAPMTLLHSDYVQLLCDSGLISIVLLGAFYMTLILKAGVVALGRGRIYSKISAALAVSSMAGVAFSMGFDNVVGHSMTSLINPFIFIGFFLRCKELKI